MLHLLCSAQGLIHLSLNYGVSPLTSLVVVHAVSVSENQITQVLLTEVI